MHTAMLYHVQKLIHPIVADEQDPSAANALQEGLGGQFGEMRTMMQYLFQRFNFRSNGKLADALSALKKKVIKDTKR